MKAQHKIYGSIAKVAMLVMLALILVIGWSQTPHLAWAQEPEPPAMEPGAVDPPSEAELGEPIKDEAYVTMDDTTDKEGGAIDIFDLSYVASRYDTDDPSADINLDGTVNIFDLAILANSFDQSEPSAEAAAITVPPSLPMVEANEDFGTFELVVEPESAETEAQGYVMRRPLRIGMGINYVKAYDPMDSYSAPDLYALIRVGGVGARTRTIFDHYDIWPYWRLGWWRYYSFPYASPDTPEANYYSVPINVEIRDDDGYWCYGYYGCRDRYQQADISPQLYQRLKTLTFYPSSCKVADENGWQTTGYWLSGNRCQVHLYTWGTEWPRGYASYFIDALWE